MNEEMLLKIVSDPVMVMDVIETLTNVFPSVYEKYSKISRDAYSFYLTGHCPSLARILYEIFDGKVTIMDSPNHVIVKIGNHFFDIRGCIDGVEDIREYRECPIDYLPMVEAVLGNNSDYDDLLTSDLVEVGKEKLLELSQVINENIKVGR